MSSYSSESDCYFCPYGTEEYPQTPFYATMGQPLVYYAQIAGCKKNNPNCFVKAFRWYTQDHKPQNRRIEEQCCNVSEFATWLDSKYEEFLAEQVPREKKELKITQTSVIVSENSGPKNERRYKRLKSPWGKFRKQTQQNVDEGHSQERYVMETSQTQSVKYIMTPKDISRAASECCHPSPELISENEVTTSNKRKSRSVTNVCPGSGRCVDIVTVHEGPPINRPKCSATSLKVTPPYEKPSATSEKKTVLSTVDRSCTCCLTVNKTDAQTQYESSAETFPVTNEVPCEMCNFKPPPQKKRRASLFPLSFKHDKRTKEVSCQYSESLKGAPCITTRKPCAICGCPVNKETNNMSFCDDNTCLRRSCLQQNIKVLPPCMPPPPPPSPAVPPLQQISSKVKLCFCRENSRAIHETTAVQTSDSCIDLEKDVRICPLLLKVVCTDKPLKDCLCDIK